jgi:hypothetical protein
MPRMTRRRPDRTISAHHRALHASLIRSSINWSAGDERLPGLAVADLFGCAGARGGAAIGIWRELGENRRRTRHWIIRHWQAASGRKHDLRTRSFLQGSRTPGKTPRFGRRGNCRTERFKVDFLVDRRSGSPASCQLEPAELPAPPRTKRCLVRIRSGNPHNSLFLESISLQ